MPKFKNQTTIVEPDGEVRVLSKTYNTRVKVQEFYATFINHVQFLYSLNNTEKNIMIYCCNNAAFNTGEVRITPKDRVRMMDFFAVKKAALSNNINSLIRKNLLIGEKGIYLINPSLFWKGTFDGRENLLSNPTISFKVEYSIESTEEEFDDSEAP
jgi:hypothetical protein